MKNCPNFPRTRILTTFLKNETADWNSLRKRARPASPTAAPTTPPVNAYILNFPVSAQRRLNGEETRRYLYLYSGIVLHRPGTGGLPHTGLHPNPRSS